MRLKEFIIFIIIFTILYVLFFMVFDYFKNKSALEKNEEDKEKNFDTNQFTKFAKFYDIVTEINTEIIKSIYMDIKNNYSI